MTVASNAFEMWMHMLAGGFRRGCHTPVVPVTSVGGRSYCLSMEAVALGQAGDPAGMSLVHLVQEGAPKISPESVGQCSSQASLEFG